MAEENYYDDAATTAAAPAPEAETSNGAEESNVALLPKSFFPGDKDLTPGSVCQVRVEEVQEDQVLVSYQHDESQAAAQEAPAVEAPPMDEEMAGLY